MKVSVIRTGLVVGILVGAMHLMWAMLVAMGWAQPLIDFIFRLHFLAPPFHIQTFDIGTAGLLVGVTGAIGLVAGMALALVWNAFHSTSR